MSLKALSITMFERKARVDERGYLQRCVTEWRHYARDMSKGLCRAQVLMKGASKKVVSRTWGAWTDFHTRRLQCRNDAEKRKRRMQLGACAGAFCRWAEACCEMRAEREQAEAAAHRAAAEEGRKLAVVGRVLKVWGQRTLSMSFGLWVERTREVRRLRGVCGKAIRRLLSLRVAFAFERWREGAVEGKRARAVAMRAEIGRAHV